MSFRWNKISRVFDPADHQGLWWLEEFAQAPATLVFDDFVRVYFSGRPRPQQGQYVSYTGYVDLDRQDLRKVIAVGPEPVLRLGNLGHFDEFGVYPFSALRFAGEIYGYYGGWTRCQSVPFNVSIGVCTSHDGATFRRLGSGPVLPYSIDEPFVLSGPKIRHFAGKLYLFYIAGRIWKLVEGRPEPVYKIRVATSEDGMNWVKAGRDLIESRIEPDEAQASPDVFFHAGRYHMFFCYRFSSDFRNASRGYRIGYAYSDDLMNWVRADDQAGLDVSAEGWDSEMVCYPHVFELDGRVYMLYLGNAVGRHGFGLAELEGGLA